MAKGSLCTRRRGCLRYRRQSVGSRTRPSQTSGTLSDDMMEEGEGVSSSGGASSFTISSAEMSRILEEYQMKVGKLLLQEQDKRYEKIEKGQRKLMAELKKDILQTVNSKIDSRMSQAMKEVRSMVDEANKAAAEAEAAATKAAAGGPLMQGSGTPSSHVGFKSGPWVPNTLEVKGFCEWARRFSDGISSEFAEEFLHKLREDLGEAGKFADWERSYGASRFAYNFKMIIVMKDGEDDVESKNRVYDLKEQVSMRLKREEFHVNRHACLVVPQASPERRELFALAGRFTSALMASSAESFVTKREYASQGITILVWRSDADDKNSHLAQGKAAGGGGGGGRWVRVAEWTSRAKNWRLYDKELCSMGIESSHLLGNLEAAE